MDTRIIQIDRHHIDDGDKLHEAARIIKEGGLVAFPTETVYGLGADACNPEAAKKIYQAKGRPSDNPLIIHISDIKDLDTYAKNVGAKARKLALAFWPGPLTMILEKKDIIPSTTSGGLETVGIRMPADEVARRFIELAETAIAAPSANVSGRPSPTKADHVIEDMCGRIDMIIDADRSRIGLESTIVDMTRDIPMILRPGFVTKSMIEEVIGEVEADAMMLAKPTQDRKPKAPGMKYRHYAPKAKLYIIEGEEKDVAKYINTALVHLSNPEKTAIMVSKETAGYYDFANMEIIGSREEESDILYNLFDILRKFDAMDIELVYSEAFYSQRWGDAIMNRLLKAAGYNRIKV